LKIQQRVFVSILGTIIPILLLSGIISYIFTENDVMTDILNELNAITSIEKSRIIEVVNRNFERLDGITSRTQLQLSMANFLESKNEQDQNIIKEILLDFKTGIPEIAEIHFLDTEASVLFSTGKNFLGKNFLDSLIFRNAQFENTINVISNENLNSVVFVSGPLRLNNQFLGVIIIETNLDLIKSSTLKNLDFKDAVELIIAVKDENGDAQIITPLLFADNTKIIIPKENINDPITHSLLQPQTTFTDSVNYYGKSSMSATRYIEETDWGLTVILDKKIALIPLMKIQYTIIFSILLVTAFSILISLSISNSLSRPIKKLQLATKEIAKGNLKEKIDVSGNNEISDLAKDISLMQEDLYDSQKEIIKAERLSAVGELSSRLSHDIRSPLSVIKMTIGLLKQTSKNLDENQIKKLDQLERSASKIQYLVENILDFVRTQEPKKEKTSILAVIGSVKNSIDIPKNIKIILPENDIEITCDPNQIEVVLQNLVTNSIQAIGSTEGSVKIYIVEESEFVIILIEDSGPGVPDNLISEIFDPLFTTKIEGTGLGLASCKSIIESHDGTLDVSNNPTIFKIKLPKNPKIH
jgi:signal transduction histidine kinase